MRREGGRAAAYPAPVAALVAASLLCAACGGPKGAIRPTGTVDIAVRLGAREYAQGDPVVLEASVTPVPDNAVLIWKGGMYPMLRTSGGRGTFQSIFGIDLQEPPGPHTATIAVSNDGAETRIHVVIAVAERAFPVQELTLPKELAVFDAPTVARIREEAAALESLFSRPPSLPRWEIPLLPPLETFRPKGFGSRRIINGEPRAPHAGVDASAPAGTPVRAIAAGTVLFAGVQFLGGNSVVLDHGGGLVSLYYHLSEISVGTGDPIVRGQRIGAVGSTGRATGPHLHFGVRAAGGRIDPGRLPGLGAN